MKTTCVNKFVNAIKDEIVRHDQAVVAVMSSAEVVQDDYYSATRVSGSVDRWFCFTDPESLDSLTHSNQDGVPKIRRVIFRDPATVVFWDDGTKTVVRCRKGEQFSEYNGLINAIAKRVYGGSSKRFHEITDKAIRKAERQF